MIKKKQQRGVALLEALIAVVLLAIGLIGTVGLQARAQATIAQADMRAEAAISTERLIGLITNDQANVGSYAKTESGAPPAVIQAWHNDVQARIPDALVEIKTDKNLYYTRIDVTIKWTRRKGDSQSQLAVVAYVAAS